MNAQNIIPIWMERHLQQDILEEKENVEFPVKLLDPNGRSFVWWLCQRFGVKTDGVMGQACGMLERYMSKKVKLLSHLPRSSREWRRIIEEMATRVPLLASVCVELSTKMLSSERQLHGYTIRDTLGQMGIVLSITQINQAEMEVLSAIGFQVPLFTNVEKALMMAVDVGMTGLLLEGVALVTEVAEFFRAYIQNEVIAITSSMHQPSTSSHQRRGIGNIRHVHFVAGSVIATGLFYTFSGTEPLPRLAFLTQSTPVYIKCIGNLIYKRVVECSSSNQQSRKRK